MCKNSEFVNYVKCLQAICSLHVTSHLAEINLHDHFLNYSQLPFPGLLGLLCSLSLSSSLSLRSLSLSRSFSPGERSPILARSHSRTGPSCCDQNKANES